MQIDSLIMASADSIINMDTHNRISQDSVIDSNFNQEKWIEQMKNILNNHGNEIDNPITIFRVPSSLKAINTEAYYTPQILALGPYHNFLPKLHKLQKCKLRQMESFRRQLNFPEFDVLVDQIKRKTGDIRECYDENFDIHDDTLSWIMVIDGLFLLQVIYQEARGNADSLEFVDAFGRKISLDLILKDVVMIENQIPFFVLDHLLSMSKSTSEIDSLFCMSVKFCFRISPIVLFGFYSRIPSIVLNEIFVEQNFENAYHLLDLLYKMVRYGASDITTQNFENSSMSSSSIWTQLWSMIKTLNIGVLSIPVRVIDLALEILKLLGISYSFEPSEEKHLIPAASELSRVKVNLCCTLGGTSDIAFVEEDLALRLPTLKLNVYSNVIIRNLLVYETIASQETPNFARYIELMEAMVQTVEDVELLKDKGIMRHDGDNDEVVKLFRGIKSSIPSGGKSDFDRTIQDLNEYYENHWKIKLKTLMKKYVYSSWKMLTILALILLLLLMVLQTVCSIFSCHGIFKIRLSSLISSF